MGIGDWGLGIADWGLAGCERWECAIDCGSRAVQPLSTSLCSARGRLAAARLAAARLEIGFAEYSRYVYLCPCLFLATPLVEEGKLEVRSQKSEG